MSEAPSYQRRAEETRTALEKAHGEDTVALAETQISASGEGFVVRLVAPAGDLNRLFFGPLRVKHLRAAGGLGDWALAEQLADEPSRAALEDIASELDQVAVMLTLDLLLGKYRRAGRATSSSPSGGPSGEARARSTT